MTRLVVDSRISIAQVNQLGTATAVDLLGGLFENTPSIVARALERRPFASRDALFEAMRATVRDLDRDQQLALIRAHPDLVGRAALAATLSKDSTAEQRAAGLSAEALTPAELGRFRDLNAEYQERFGFPYVICARENRKESILRGLAERLAHDLETEIASALREIERIAWHRLDALVSDDAARDGEERQ